MINIVYLYPKKYYEQKMSRGRVWYGEAVAKRSDCNLVFWGPGWDGYVDNLPVRENLNNLEFSVDAIWAYKPEECVNITDRDCPLVVCYNEAWPHIPGKALEEVEECGADLVIHHHHNDRKCFDGASGIVRHIPHGTPEWFSSFEYERLDSCCVTGVQSKEIYPLRDRYRKLSGVAVRTHPGYRLQSSMQCESQATSYASYLSQYRASLCCTSKYRYLLAKIVESMMAGCVVVTDAADDPEFEKMREHLIVLDEGISDNEIQEVCNEITSDPERWSQFAERSQKYALNHLTTEHYAERFIACLREIL